MASIRPDVVRITKRRDFLAAAGKGNKVVATTLVLQGYPPVLSLQQEDENAAASGKKRGAVEGDARFPIRVGFTVTKKTGNAVKRNRIRRRLRAAVDALMAENGRPGWDYVVIGRARALEESYAIILRDLRYAIRKTAKLEEAR